MSVSRHHSGKCHHYVVQQLIVCQWPCRIYYHVAEYLFGAISEKFRTFDMQINFDSPNFSLSSVVGVFLSIFSKSRNFYHFINQPVA